MSPMWDTNKHDKQMGRQLNYYYYLCGCCVCAKKEVFLEMMWLIYMSMWEVICVVLVSAIPFQQQCKTAQQVVQLKPKQPLF